MRKKFFITTKFISVMSITACLILFTGCSFLHNNKNIYKQAKLTENLRIPNKYKQNIAISNEYNIYNPIHNHQKLEPSILPPQ